MPFKKKPRRRLSVLSIIMSAVLVAYSVQVFSLQVSNAETYIAQAQGISYRKAVIKAQRGEILDSTGREIAVNREGYNIVFNKAYFDMKKANDTILKLTNLLRSHDTAWNDALPLQLTAPYGFTDDAASVEILKAHLKLAHYATADNCLEEMIKKYELEGYTPDQRRTIMGVRYTLERYDFSVSNPFTLAEDVSSEIMQIVLESGVIIDGVTINVVPFREYVDGTLAPHLIGTVGPIYAEEWNSTYKGKGYSYDDKVGKSGIEKLCEAQLHGTDGEITYKINSKGKILSSEITRTPVAGKTIMLNLDKSIQSATQTALASTVDTLKGIGKAVTGAAAVMLNIKSGGVIASANYPSYNLATYYKDYQSLVTDTKGKPLTDRAFQGIYPPGSTVKPAVAVAALENGKLTAGETIFCKRRYTRFIDYQPNCMHYHGNITLNGAISKSCNYFFFEMGYRLGLTNINKYYQMFGLGVKTGVDVNDSSGLLVKNPADGMNGSTLQAAIGQMNAFTPLQLAVYVSTLANEGVRYRASLIDRVVSYNMSETYSVTQPEVLEQFEISDSTIRAVKAGMLSVTEDGTGSGTFKNYPINVGGKTGTSQVAQGADHSVFVAFAPYENPQIAVAIVLEHGASSRHCAGVAKAMMDAYFFSDDVTLDTTKPFEVLP